MQFLSHRQAALLNCAHQNYYFLLATVQMTFFYRFNFRRALQLRSFTQLKLRLINTTKQFKWKYAPWVAFLMGFSHFSISCSMLTPQTVNMQMKEASEHINGGSKQEAIMVVSNNFLRKNEEAYKSTMGRVRLACSELEIKKVLVVTDKDEKKINEFVGDLRHLADGENQAKISFFYLSQHYSEPFYLQDSQDWSLAQQITEIKAVTPRKDQKDMLHQIKFVQSHAMCGKTLVIKECLKRDSCEGNFKGQIKRLVDDGLMAWRAQQFLFYLVTSQVQAEELHRHFQLPPGPLDSEIFLLRNDMLGSSLTRLSSWKAAQDHKQRDRFKMFIGPRVHIISQDHHRSYSQLRWYLETVRCNGKLSVSVNNTNRFLKAERQSNPSPKTLQAIKLLYSVFPSLNYLVVNNWDIHGLFRHICMDEKFVLFQQTDSELANKMVLHLQKYEKLLHQGESQADVHQLFLKNQSQKINQFIRQPIVADRVFIEIESQINVDSLRQIISEKKAIILRVCKERCFGFLSAEIRKRAEDYLVVNKKESRCQVAWIDSEVQNIGLKDGDYLLLDGNPINLSKIL